jgi:hypothetical protein
MTSSKKEKKNLGNALMKTIEKLKILNINMMKYKGEVWLGFGVRCG